MKQKELSFEKALSDLEGITKALEAGQTDLEEALALYEKGMELVKTCNKALEMAHAIVEKLSIKQGEMVRVPLDVQEDA